ncbi:ABC transporter substrate-binding protein [Kribbella pratensis]|jgi:peptide/nickel transport system substrate-binding protein|uniref:Peptide/nickel transport system substrate-binding protein n=1 Tax=Kribbella pratensis TaxID=2512112 RepID=A0A4R8CNM8_9ACTN|nr:ABC transporter substrate-binding protein [Kribbella pratensis]TDW77713.1 peptide/nickel transport system substrate-binding protein [Kribbella pratensis]
MNHTLPGQITRRRLLGWGGGLAAGVGLAPMVTACGDDTSSAATSAGGGTLTMGINAAPDTLDPGATGLALTLLISFALFDPLVYWLPDGNGGAAFHPGLAESWTISPDASKYTFKLRKGVTFHDGTPFDAKAVKATYDHVVDPKTKSKSGLGALGPYKETKILDDYTVQIVFTAPNASFLHQQAAGNFGISSPAALAKYGPIGFGNNPVGTGPFTFQSYQPGSQLTLLKNPKYTWGPKALGDGPAKLDKLVFRIVTDDSGRYNALQSGQLQIAMNLPPNNISAAQKSGKYQQLLVPSIGTPLGMPINVTKPPTDDPMVRQAIMYAVDQDALVKNVLYDVYKPAHNVLTPITPGFSAAASKTYSYDPDKAGKLLDQAGWKAGDGGTRTKNGQKLNLEIILFSGGGLELPTQFVVSELQKVGFSSNTSVQPFATAQASFNSGVHNLGSFGYYGADPYLLNIWVNSNAIQSGFNWSHYANPAVDKLIAKANSTAADATRNGLYEQVGQKLMQDSMYLPLWDVAGAFTLSPKVRNLHQTLNGYLAFHSATLG